MLFKAECFDHMTTCHDLIAERVQRCRQLVTYLEDLGPSILPETCKSDHEDIGTHDQPNGSRVHIADVGTNEHGFRHACEDLLEYK